MRSLLKNRHGERGTMIVFYSGLIPVIIVAFLALFTRIETTQMETQRNQWRAQARLLAESALTRADEVAASPLDGTIEGIGTYRLERTQTDGAGDRLTATGWVDGRRARWICTIDALTFPGSAIPHPLDIAWRVEKNDELQMENHK